MLSYISTTSGVLPLLLEVRFLTSQFCQCFVCLKAVLIYEPNVPSSYNDSRGGTNGYRGISSPVSSIRRCVGGLLSERLCTLGCQGVVGKLTLYLF